MLTIRRRERTARYGGGAALALTVRVVETASPAALAGMVAPAHYFSSPETLS